MPSPSRSIGASAFFVGAFFLCVYLLSGSSDLLHNGDTYLRYQTTSAIVDHGRLWIEHPMWIDTRVARGVGDHLYAFYAPGQSVFMVPLYMFGKVVAQLLSLPVDVTTLYASRSLDLILGAALAVVFYLMTQAVGYSRRVGALLTLVFGLATTAWPDTQSALEQTQVDLFLLVAVYTVWKFVSGGQRDRRWMVAAGCAVGLAVFTRYDALLYVAALALYPALMRLSRRTAGIMRDWIAFSVGVIPWLALVGVWNWVRFGSPVLTGLHERTFGEPFWSGFLGLTISPGKGLLWYVPLVLLLPAAAPAFVQRLPSLSLLMTAMILLPLVFYANVLYWHGDPAWGPRYLYTALPYLILPLGEILCGWRRRSRALRITFLGILAASLLIQVAAVSVTQWRYWYRLEATQQRTAHVAKWTGQPFHWGALRYHYYWNPQRSPVLIQVDNLYQVLRLRGGARKYLLAGQPDPWVSNPVERYPVNTLAYWWADERHPLLGLRTRALIAMILSLLAAASLGGLVGASRDPPAHVSTQRDVPLVATG